MLEVHVVCHPDCRLGAALGDRLIRTLFEDPDDLTAHGLRIPVRIWTGSGEGRSARPPRPPDRDDTKRIVMVVLVDDEFLATGGWREYLDELADRDPERDFVVLPVELSPSAAQLGPPASKCNPIRAHLIPEAVIQTRILNAIIHRIIREWDREPLRVFLSYARRDGRTIAQAVRSYFRNHTQLHDWFDEHDVEYGSDWQNQIRGAASHNLLLAVHTDRYATREWCRIELLQAKRAGSPVVVLDALQEGEARSFPYMGNGPVVRWNGGRKSATLERLHTTVLLEALRFTYFPQRVTYLCHLHGLPFPDRVSPRPPELVTMPLVTDPHVLVYPDPPLGVEELTVLSELVPQARPKTPAMLLAGA